MSEPHRYHHGALRQALIDATEALLAEHGPEAFSLREVARRAGVSPAAPAHHFGDAAGLLTAVASLGFAELTRSLREGDARGGADALAALREQGVEYVAFALRRPGLFRLMFRQGRLREDAELEQHARAAFEVLAEGVRRSVGVRAATAMRPAHWQAVTALWSLVHGYAHLAIAGKFDPMCGPGGLPDFVAGSLRPVLQSILDCLFPSVTTARGTRAAASAPSRTGGRR